MGFKLYNRIIINDILIISEYFSSHILDIISVLKIHKTKDISILYLSAFYT